MTESKSPSMKRAVFVFAFLLSAACRGQFAPAALTWDELVSIYDVPVKERPAHKVEWTVPRMTRFRLQWQVREGDGAPWKVVQATERAVDRRVLVTFVWTLPARSRAGDGPLVVPVRFGFESTTGTGWSSFDGVLAGVGVAREWSRSSDDPANLMSVRGEAIEYRLCLEKLD